MIRILLVDDQTLFLDSMKSMFQGNSDYSFVATANGEQELFERLRTERFDIILLDVEIPSSLGKDGIELARFLKNSSEYNQVKIISMSVNRHSYVLRILLQEIGVDGYIDKSNCKKETLFAAVKTVLSGSIYTSPGLKEKVNRILKMDILSDRERQVLKEIVKGRTTPEIAEALFISPKTVDNHRQSIHLKMKCKSIAHLAEVYYRYAYLHDYEYDLPNFKRKI